MGNRGEDKIEQKTGEVKKKQLDNFTNDQLSVWPLARDNYRALKNACVRTLNAGGLEVKVQHNPARIVSASADVGREAILRRKCFLCRENRPEEQIRLKFEGRKGRKYDILVNPYPIFNEHFVLAMDRHCPQSIWKRYVDMLDMAKSFPGYTFMYNGPECGASAPDHHHFQALPRRILPLECDAGRLLDTMPDSRVLEYVTSVKEAELYHYHKFTRGIFILCASTAKSMAKLFYRLLDCTPVRDGEPEPMFNLITWYESGQYRSAVMLRGRHRPHHYSSEGEDHFTVSPGCADMAGFFVIPDGRDFDRIDGRILGEILDEVSVPADVESLVVRRLTRTQPLLSVGIMSAPEITFEILSDGAGVRKAVFREGKIEYDGALYDELYFEEQTLSTMFAEAGFVLHDVTIGVGFHWERKETQKFAGALKIIASGKKLTAINVIGVEDYLVSVISSEMKSTASEEFLKAHAVISRSWVMSKILAGAARRNNAAAFGSGEGHPSWVTGTPSLVTHLDMVRHAGDNAKSSLCAGEIPVIEIIRWYGHEDHRLFDVCADDHCQRYQGLTRETGNAARKAVDATWGEVLAYGGEICDARFSKCCGGMTEKFSTCWEDRDFPYLAPVRDVPGDSDSPAFCDTSDREVLSQVLNDYDLETTDFFRWTVSYGIRELSDLVAMRSGHDIGTVKALVPEHRGPSGRIDRLRIVGTKAVLVVGKELEIRRMLSESHLKSSAFDVVYYDSAGTGIPAEAIERQMSRMTEMPDIVRIELHGSGWGHGVGLCQIGAAVMASRGCGYREILSHYYSGAVVEPASCLGGDGRLMAETAEMAETAAGGHK